MMLPCEYWPMWALHEPGFVARDFAEGVFELDFAVLGGL